MQDQKAAVELYRERVDFARASLEVQVDVHEVSRLGGPPSTLANCPRHGGDSSVNWRTKAVYLSSSSSSISPSARIGEPLQQGELETYSFINPAMSRTTSSAGARLSLTYPRVCSLSA